MAESPNDPSRPSSPFPAMWKGKKSSQTPATPKNAKKVKSPFPTMWQAKRLSSTPESSRFSDSLETVPEQEQVLPAYDRTVDQLCWGGREPNADQQFRNALPPVFSIQYHKRREPAFFRILLPSIRRKIYAYVYEVPADDKHVNLSSDFAVGEVFPPDHFIVPWDLLCRVEGGLIANRRMRDELLTFFWSTYHFHITISPFTTGQNMSCLSTDWLNYYGERVNHLTIEADMTKLGCSASKDAGLLKIDHTKMQILISNLADALGRRIRKNVMANLTLLIRRYHGFRPASEVAEEGSQELVPYCPDREQFIFTPLGKLKHILLQCRMSGFSQSFTTYMMRLILEFPEVKPRDDVECCWPDYERPQKEVTYISSFSISSTSFSDNPNSSTHSLSSALGTSSSRRATTSTGSYNSSSRPSMDSSSDLTGVSYNHTPSMHTPFTDGLVHLALKESPIGLGISGHRIASSSTGSDGSNDTVHVSRPQSRAEGPNKGRDNTNGFRVSDSAASSSRTESLTFDLSDNPPPTPVEPELLNALNETDPAFARTLGGLRLDQGRKTTAFGEANYGGGEEDEEENSNDDKKGPSKSNKKKSVRNSRKGKGKGKGRGRK